MASSKKYLNFILEQLSELEDITYRTMMGEYIIYYHGKIVGGIYDDRLLGSLNNIKGKDAVSNLVGKVVVELEEFVALRNAKSADEAKFVVSARTSTVRFPYERFSRDVKRMMRHSWEIFRESEDTCR